MSVQRALKAGFFIYGDNMPLILFTVREAVFFLNRSVGELNAMLAEGRGPAFIKVGRHVRYTIRDLLIWHQAQRLKSMSNVVGSEDASF
jgi:hypothetical protein